MAAPVNILQSVATYNESNLALLLNSYCFISTANKKFERFNDDIPKNLGSTVTFDKSPRMTTTNSLVASFQPLVQRVQPLVVDQQISTSYEYNSQQFIFQVRDYMNVFGKSAVAEIGSKIEQNVALNAETHTFRYYGDGVTPISTYLQLAQALAQFRNFGAAQSDTKGFLSDLTFPAIINSGLNQFTLDRGNKESMSWEIGDFSKCEWYQSNLLPVHVSGNVGNLHQVLTVVSTGLDAFGNVNSITFSGASASDASSVFANDSFTFNDGVAGQPNMRFLTFIGGNVSGAPVQFRAVAAAASTAGSQVTVSIYPPLSATVGQGQGDAIYMNNPIVPGMQVSSLPSHRCGLIYSGNPLFLAMPKLQNQEPFPTSVVQDPESGASLRQYWGTLFGQNLQGMIHDCIWGSTLVDEYAMKVALPL